MPPVDAMSAVHEQFRALASKWYASLFSDALGLFSMLAVVEIALAAILFVSYRSDGDYMAATLLRRMLAVLFFYAVLLNSQTWLYWITDSFMIAGARASGVPALSPWGVAQMGISLAGNFLNQTMNLSLLTNLNFAGAGIALICAFGIFLSYQVIAMQLGLALCMGFVILGGGVLLLGFSAFGGTRGISERYLSFVIANGVKLFTIYLIVGAGQDLARGWAEMINTSGFLSAFNMQLSILGACMLYGFIGWAIPNIAQAMLMGSFWGGLSEGISATAMAVSAAKTAAMAPMAAVSIAHSAAGIAQGGAGAGGVRGAVQGLAAGGAALGQEAMNASVPRLGRMAGNMQARQQGGNP